MSKLNEVLQAEILRLAKKEIRKSSDSLTQSVLGLKRSLSKVLQILAEIEKKIDKQRPSHQSGKASQTFADQFEDNGAKSRLSGGLLKKLRKRLGISQMEMAQLLGVSQPAVASWEQDRVKPRSAPRNAIIALRDLSRAEAQAKLADLQKQNTNI